MSDPLRHVPIFGNESYYLHVAAEALVRPEWLAHWKPGRELQGRHAGATAFVLCPGPSLAAYPPEAFAGRLTIAVNSAGFYAAPSYWCMIETRYARFVARELRAGRLPAYDALFDGDYVMSLRAAITWFNEGASARTTFYMRHEEGGAIPRGRRGRPVQSATLNAIATARLMGCARCVVIGMDLSKPGGVPYVPGVPYSAAGAARGYEEQIEALRTFKLEGMEMLNASPHAERLQSNMAPISYDLALRMLHEAAL